MTKRTLVISDTHFNHPKILTFKNDKDELIRPFSSTKEMDEFIIDNWNMVVDNGDKVYHLGDVFFGDPEYFKRLWPRLNGSKRLIVGNHDDIRFLSSGGFFKNVYMWRKLPELGCILSHVPLHNSTLQGKHIREDQGFINVHGHIHEKAAPSVMHINVSVEQTGYQPVELEPLLEDRRKLLANLAEFEEQQLAKLRNKGV